MARAGLLVEIVCQISSNASKVGVMELLLFYFLVRYVSPDSYFLGNFLIRETNDIFISSKEICYEMLPLIICFPLTKGKQIKTVCCH